MNSNDKIDTNIQANQNQTLDSQVEKYQTQLRRLASEISLIEARERREIASDLHDHIGQALAYVSQKVSTLKGNAIFSGMEEDFSEILSILNQTIRYTRNLTVEISPPVLYEIGLHAAIDWLAERTEERYKLKVTTTQQGVPQVIAEDVKVFMFKAIQELIVNITKHAEAKKIRIETNWRDKDFEIVVSDNGKGFESKTYESKINDHNCFGLFSIRERLSYIGGSLSIESIPGDGTTVSMTAPYTIADEALHD